MAIPSSLLYIDIGVTHILFLSVKFLIWSGVKSAETYGTALVVFKLIVYLSMVKNMVKFNILLIIFNTFNYGRI